MKLSKTAQKILQNGYENIDKTQTRKIKAMYELLKLNLVTVENCKNDYGYEWLLVKSVK